MTTTLKRTRKTKAEIIAALEAKLTKLKSSPTIAKQEAKLTKDSPGMTELLAAFDNAAKLNGVKSSELIPALARMKRARLIIKPSSKE